MKARFGLALGCLVFQTLSASAQDAAPLPNGAVVQLGGPRLQVSGDIVDCAFTPDKRGLIVVHKAADRNLSNVVLFDVVTGLQRKHFDIHEAAKVVVAKHKPLMAVVTMHAFEVWDLDEGRLVRRWPRPDPWYKGSIAISPDGSQVIVSSRFMDPTPILRFDVATGDELSPLQTRPECQVSFSPDGKKIFTVSATFRSNERRRFGVGSALGTRSPARSSPNWSIVTTTPSSRRTGGRPPWAPMAGKSGLWTCSRRRRGPRSMPIMSISSSRLTASDW